MVKAKVKGGQIFFSLFFFLFYPRSLGSEAFSGGRAREQLAVEEESISVVSLRRSWSRECAAGK